MAKHVLNDPRSLVNDSLQGLARLNPSVNVDVDSRVVHLASIPQDRVALISGGGSGHEPAHAGFVGQGLLSAAVCGNVFASPNVAQIRKAIELAHNDKGTLAVIMRYTGDVLLFGLAKEQGAVTNPDSQLRLTVVGDDCAVGRAQGGLVGRRGLAGTVLVYKLASALADEGKGIDDVHAMAEWAAERVGTIGAGLEHCHVPGTGSSESHLSDTEIEIGMGIHNESGIERCKLTTSKELVAKMLKYIIDTSDKDRAFLPFQHDGKDEVVLLINNLGGMSELELSSIANDTVLALQKTETPITVRRLIVGSVMTSLNLPGFSITLLLLPRDGSPEPKSSSRILDLLDAPASSPGWKFCAQSDPGKPETYQRAESLKPSDAISSSGLKFAPGQFVVFKNATIAACEAVIKAEPEITKFDTIAGDGDCGLCLKSGGEGVIAAFKQGQINEENIVTAVPALAEFFCPRYRRKKCLNIAQVIEKDMDGTSGALYSQVHIFTNALAAGLATSGSQQGASTATPAVWAAAFSHALSVLYTYTAARRPSRTLIDPLSAFVSSLADLKGADLKAAVVEARKAAEETRKLEAKVGRAAYIGREQLEEAQVPDPGAWGIVQLLEGAQSILGA